MSLLAPFAADCFLPDCGVAWPSRSRSSPRATKKKRLQFARNHRNWTVDDWSRVLWSDESKFNMNVFDGAVYVRRRPGEQLADCCTRKTVKHGGGTIMAWGCFAAAGVCRIHKVVGVMKKEQYVDILQN